MNNVILYIFLFLVRFDKIEIVIADDVEFFLYNESNLNDESRIYIGNEESLLKLKLDIPVRIIIHGWKGNSNSIPYNLIRNAYIKKGNLNIITVNWKKAQNDNYFLVTTYLKEVSKEISNMIKFLNEKKNIKYSNIYIIGHSLGAHIAGLTGRNLKPNKIDTIFALDPARILSNNDDYVKVTDADYVEVIHTNSEPIGVGSPEKIGNSDFYPNYGRLQPQCKNRLIKISCNHLAAVLYFAESINSNIGFYGNDCPKLNSIKNYNNCECNEQCQKFQMGGEPSLKQGKNNNGTYYIKTNSKYPFAMGKSK